MRWFRRRPRQLEVEPTAAWLAEHGFKIDNVRHAVIGIGHDRRPYLVVETYAVNERGQRFLDPISHDEPAYERYVVPLRRFPS